MLKIYVVILLGIVFLSACNRHDKHGIRIEIQNPYSLKPVIQLNLSGKCLPETQRWLEVQSKQLSVHVVQDNKTADAPLLIFNNRVEKNCVLLSQPYVDLGFGETYEIRWQPEDSPLVSFRHTVPKFLPTEEPLVMVKAMHPTDGIIPENIIYFQFDFTAPVVFDETLLEKIRIVDAYGNVIDNPWFREDFSGQVSDKLYIRIHPGRVKTGLYDAYEYLAPVFKKGGTYKIEIIGEIRDIYHRKTAISGFSKTLKVTGRDTVKPALKSVSFSPKNAKQTEALRIRFTETIRNVSALEGITVLDADKNPFPGTLSADGQNEAVWLFVPQTSWQKKMSYYVLIDQEIEDLASNRMNLPFEFNQELYDNRITEPLTKKIMYR